MIRTVYAWALTPIWGRSSSAPSSWRHSATGVAALKFFHRGYATQSSSSDPHRRRRRDAPRQDGGRSCSASSVGSAWRTTTGVAARTASPSPHARDAFHEFLRARNHPFIIGSTTSLSQLTNDLGDVIPRTDFNSLFPHCASTSVLVRAGRDGVTEEERRALAKGVVPPSARRNSSDNILPQSALQLSWQSSTEAVSLRDPNGTRQDQFGEEVTKRCVRDPPVLGEWSLTPPNVSTRSEDHRGHLQSREPCPDYACDNIDSGGRTGRRSMQRDRPPEPEKQQHHRASERRRDALTHARQHTALCISNRYRRADEQACLHAYRILKQVERSLAHWARWRRHKGRRHSVLVGNAIDVRGDQAADPARRERRTPLPTKRYSSTKENSTALSTEDVDAVESRFFEYAGQIQRTLHALTPRHFDVVRNYRLRAEPPRVSPSAAGTPPSRSNPSEEATAAAAAASGGGGDGGSLDVSFSATLPPLFLLRLLWCLLHIHQLFYSIGRCASLPRSAVNVYVQSSNCQYGIREVLRVLGDELARSVCLTLTQPQRRRSSHAQRRGGDGGASCRSVSPPSPPPSLLFSSGECFQLFSAAFYIPSEEVPGVPLHDLSAHYPARRDGGASGRDATASDSPQCHIAALAQFQRDCITTGPETMRMPLEEWCVRWWVCQYAALESTSSEQVPPLSMGEAMDVIQACMYATRSVQTAPATRGGHAAQWRPSQQSFVMPLSYLETPPHGASNRGRSKRTSSASAPGSGGGDPREGEEGASPLRLLGRRYRPQLSGALGANRVALRIPYYLGQRFVRVFLEYLLSSASSTPTQEGGKGSSERAAKALFARIEQLRRCCGRDAVRDIALLCTAILFFEVFSPVTAAFMAHAAPLCQNQVELLSGHEISCVLLAYASLHRWERAASAQRDPDHSPGRGSSTHGVPGAAGRDDGPLRDATVEVQSASAAAVTAATAQGFKACDPVWRRGARAGSATSGSSPPGPSPQPSGHQSTAEHRGSRGAPDWSSSEGASKDPPSPSQESWHLFYVTLASRAGHLSDTLTEDDVTRVLRAMELTGIEHEDLRRALESSLRMRNMGRRVLFET